MGNEPFGLCNRDQNRIEGFDDSVLIKQSQQTSLLQLPKRSPKVDEVYKKVTKQKTLDYSLEKQKSTFKPLVLEIFMQKGVYVGWVKNNLPHGPGQIYFQNQNYLQAIFKQGKIDCEDGIFIEKDMNYYRGSFKNSKQEGFGTLFKDNQIIKSNFRQGRPSGKGQKYFQDGRIYKGNLTNGKIQGKGILYLKNNETYEGYFKNEKKCGIGSLKNNYYQYYGPFREDVKEGKGTIIFKNGNKFEGWFEEDMIKGYGEWHRVNQPVEKGTFHIKLPK